MKRIIHPLMIVVAVCMLNAKLYGQTSGAQNLNSAKAQYLQGELYLSIGKSDSAAIAFKKGLSIDAEDWRCLVGLGQALLEKSPVEAEKLFNQAAAIRKYREEPLVAARIASAYLSPAKPDYEKVRLWLNNALAIKATEPQTYIVGGDMYLKQKKGNDAVSSYQKALELDPNNVEAYYKLAKVYAQGRIYTLAMENIGKAVALDSLYLPSHRLEGEVNYQRGLYSEAAESYRQLMRMEGATIEDRSRYAASLFFDKKYDQALPEFEKILQMNPDYPAALRLKGYAHQYKREYEQGVSTLQKFFSVGDSSIFLDTDYQYYGRLLMGIGKDSLAFVNFDKAISIAEPNTKSMLYKELLDSVENRKQYELADSYYKKIETESGMLSAVQYNAWGQDCYSAAYNRLIKATRQDSVLYVKYAQRADTLFAKVTELAPQSYLGVYWQANAKAMLDPGFAKMDAKPLYEKLLGFESLPLKPKMAAYKYLGSCSILNDELEQGLSYYTKYLELNPTDKEILGYVANITAHLNSQKK